MPLRLDDNYRGPRAFHVRSHRRLGKHRTIIKPALAIVNWLIDNPQVAKVDLGKMISGQEGHRFNHRLTIEQKKGDLKVMLVAKSCAQVITVTVRDGSYINQLAQELEARWMTLNAAND